MSEDGEVIGISGLFFTEAQFGLVASAADVLQRVERLIAGEDVAGLGDRRLPKEGGKLQDDITLDHGFDDRVYVLYEPADTDVNIRVEGDTDAGFTLIDVFAYPLLNVNENTSGLEFGSATTELQAPYFLWVWQNPNERSNLSVTIDRNMVPFHDADDGARILVGQTLLASIDHPADLDYFVIDLVAGDTIDITANSVNIDPILGVSFPGATDAQLVFDDDSAGGIFGLNPELTYRAPHSGTYFIVISDANQAAVGGYFLTVAQAPEGVVAVSPPEAAPTIDSPFGPMALYESEIYPFSIQYPADWTKQPTDPQQGIVAQYVGEQAEAFLITEENVEALGLRGLTLSEYVDVVLSVLSTELPGYEFVSRKQAVTEQGLPIEVVEFSYLGGFQKGTYLVYLYEGQTGFIAAYFSPTAHHEELKALIDYSFGTFQVKEAPAPAAAATPLSQTGLEHVDTALILYEEGRWEEAIAELNQAVLLLPGYALAYEVRGTAYRQLGDFQQAIQDYDEAIRLDPQHASTYNNRGLAYGDMERFLQAIQDFDEAILVTPQYVAAYANRAWVYINLDRHQRAIQDLDEAIRLDPQHAYAYFLRGAAYTALRKSQLGIQDFDEAIRLDPQYAEAYYGRGSAYYGLDQFQRAIQDFDEAVRLDPKYAKAYGLRALAYTHLGKDFQAQQDVDRAVALGIARDFLIEKIETIKNQR